jgi:hypothetical protein
MLELIVHICCILIIIMLDKIFIPKGWMLCEHKSKNIITSSFVMQWGHLFDINFLSKILLLKAVESVEQCSNFSRTENVLWEVWKTLLCLLSYIQWTPRYLACMGNGVCWLHESASCMRTTLNRLPIQSQNNVFSLFLAWQSF